MNGRFMLRSIYLSIYLTSNFVRRGGRLLCDQHWYQFLRGFSCLVWWALSLSTLHLPLKLTMLSITYILLLFGGLTVINANNFPIDISHARCPNLVSSKQNVTAAQCAILCDTNPNCDAWQYCTTGSCMLHNDEWTQGDLQRCWLGTSVEKGMCIPEPGKIRKVSERHRNK